MTQRLRQKFWKYARQESLTTTQTLLQFCSVSSKETPTKSNRRPPSTPLLFSLLRCPYFFGLTLSPIPYLSLQVQTAAFHCAFSDGINDSARRIYTISEAQQININRGNSFGNLRPRQLSKIVSSSGCFPSFSSSGSFFRIMPRRIMLISSHHVEICVRKILFLLSVSILWQGAFHKNGSTSLFCHSLATGYLGVATTSPFASFSSSCLKASDKDNSDNSDIGFKKKRKNHYFEQYDDAEWLIQQETYVCNLQLAELAEAATLRNRTAAWMAYDLFRTQRHPDTVAYNSVLKALAKISSSSHRKAAKVAVELLQEMERVHLEQEQAHKGWKESNVADDDGGRQVGRPPRIRVKPNFRTYSTIMDAWGRQASQNGAEMAESYFRRMYDRFLETGDGGLRPNTITYNTAISAWAKAKVGRKGADKCEELLEEMQRSVAEYNNQDIDGNCDVNDPGDGGNNCAIFVPPDVISYNTVISAWARSGVPDAGHHAERWLCHMIKEGDVEPNARTYTSVIDAFSRSSGIRDSAERAHTLLLEMEAKASEASNTDKWTLASSLRPDYITYTSVINAYALSKTEPLKAHKAYALLKRMKKFAKNNRSLTPNLVTYNSVLNACATSSLAAVEDALVRRQSKEKADGDDGNVLDDLEVSSRKGDAGGTSIKKLPSVAELVRAIYNELVEESSSFLKPDYVTYGTVLKALGNLFWGEPDRVAFGTRVFRDACASGHVNMGVISQLRQAVPVDVYRELLPSQAISEDKSIATLDIMDHIPRSWSRNVHDFEFGRSRGRDATRLSPPVSTFGTKNRFKRTRNPY